jgi:hypothetical protein
VRSLRPRSPRPTRTRARVRRRRPATRPESNYRRVQPAA